MGLKKNQYIFSIFSVLYSFSCVRCDSLLVPLVEGSACLWKDRLGKCVQANRCMSAFIDNNNDDPPGKCDPDSEDPLICCTDCSLVNDTKNYVFDMKIGVYPKTGVKSRDYCLKMLHEQDYPCKRFSNLAMEKLVWEERNCHLIKPVVKRKNMIDNPFAWKEELAHLAILGYGAEKTSLVWRCAGSIISDYFVLTSAHCIKLKTLGLVTHVDLDSRKRSDFSEHWAPYRVRNTYIHPGYSPPVKYHDIGLVRTEIPFLFNLYVQPICLPHTYDLHKSNAGATSLETYKKRGEKPGNLYTVRLERISTKSCSVLFRHSELLPDGFNATTQVCYGYRYKQGVPCGHDKGASLYRKSGYFPCGFSIIGVTSIRRLCDSKLSYGLYTNIVHYNNWIESIVWP